MFDFTKDYVLENDTIRIEPLSMHHLEYLLPFALNEPELWKYSLLSGAGAEGMQAYLQAAIEGRTRGQAYPFAVFDKRTQQYAGSTRFYEFQLAHAAVLLGYTWYGQAFQGTTLNKHCKYLLLQFAFEDMDWKRVEFRANTQNARSIRAMQRIGCTVEGVLRSNYVGKDGRRRDSIVLSILQEEWHESVKTRLQQALVANKN